ncbi:MAG: M28 family peptidase [Planctomycetota bacterium]
MSKAPIRIASLLAATLASVPATWASPPGVVISQQVDIATYTYYHQDLLYIHTGQSRGLVGAQHDPARTNIFNTFQSFGLTVALEPFIYAANTYYNVVATQPGTDNPTQTVVIGAHFDSVNCPGADDNATGTAMVMELARVLSQHRSSKRLRFVAFDREEQGLRGSIAYVAAHAADNTVMAVTADMIGHDSGAYGMDLYSKASSSAVTNGVASAIATYGNGLNSFINVGNFAFSDHWSFENNGIPAVVVIERCYTCNTNYHTTNDRLEFSPTYISYPLLNDIVRSMAGYLVDAVPISLWGDKDNDGDVDDSDFTQFRLCFGGPSAPVCYAFDKNMDKVIDCNDWPAFQTAYQTSTGNAALLTPDAFTAVLLQIDTTPANVCVCDLIPDGMFDGRDVQAYVAAATAP